MEQSISSWNCLTNNTESLLLLIRCLSFSVLSVPPWLISSAQFEMQYTVQHPMTSTLGADSAHV